MELPFGLAGDGPVHRYEAREPQGWLPRGWIDGLILSNDGTDATNDVAIAAGCCRSTSNIGPDGLRTTLAKCQADLDLPVAVIKQLDVAWAPANYEPENGIGGGARSGFRSSSSIADTTWHIFAIGGFDCPTDVLAHDGVDPSAVLPTGYTAWRRIGSILRVSAALKAFTQHGDLFLHTTLSQDVGANAPGTSAVTRALTVPLGVRVLADVIFNVANVSSGNNTFGLLTDLDATDESPSGTLCNVADAIAAASGSTHAVANMRVRTNTSAQVRSRVSFSSANITVYITTRGWVDDRGRNV